MISFNQGIMICPRSPTAVAEEMGIEPQKLQISRQDIMDSGKIQELIKILEGGE